MTTILVVLPSNAASVPPLQVEYEPQAVDLTDGEASRCRFHTLRFATARQTSSFADQLAALSEPHKRMLSEGIEEQV